MESKNMEHGEATNEIAMSGGLEEGSENDPRKRERKVERQR